MNYSTNIQSVVMRRIHRVHTIRAFLAPLTISAFVFALALWGIGREVWVARVFANMPALTPAHLASLVSFFEAAFLNTRFIVQVLIVLLVGAAIWIAYNFVQLFRNQLAY